MSVFTLKMIACITMLVDHMGVVLFPDIIVLRIIGRIAMPIFSFLIVNGFLHTKNIKNYALRLLVFAAVSQIPFSIMVDGRILSPRLNIFFTEFIGLIAIYLFDKYKSKYPSVSVLYIVAAAFLAELIKADYGIYGILTIAAFYLAGDSRYKMVIYNVIVTVLFLCFTNSMSDIQIFSLIALVPICLYNQKLGVKCKYLFYIFYPLHIVVLLLMKKLIFY